MECTTITKRKLNAPGKRQILSNCMVKNINNQLNHMNLPIVNTFLPQEL